MGEFIVLSTLAGVVFNPAPLRFILPFTAVGIVAAVSLALDLVFECKPSLLLFLRGFAGELNLFAGLLLDCRVLVIGLALRLGLICLRLVLRFYRHSFHVSACAHLVSGLHHFGWDLRELFRADHGVGLEVCIESRRLLEGVGFCLNEVPVDHVINRQSIFMR
jgi:hypothetical protein